MKKVCFVKEKIGFCDYHYFITSPSPFSLSLLALGYVPFGSTKWEREKNERPKSSNNEKKINLKFDKYGDIK